MMDDLNERLRKIENRLDAIERTLNAQPPSTQPRQSPPPPPKPNRRAYPPSPLILWLKENWLVSLGIFLILLASGWFVSYAFANNWIGEKARVIFIFISGAILYSVGLWLMRKQSKGGQSLIILGEAIAIIALFAGHQFYSILPALPAFILMLAVVTATAMIAIKNHLEGLGLSSIVFAAIIPVLIRAESPNAIFLMLYVLIIDAAALWMWAMRSWGKTFYVAWIATIAYSFSLETIHERLIATLFAWAFYLLFFLPIAFPIYKKKLPALPLKGAFILLTLIPVFTVWIDSLAVFPWNALSSFIASLLSAALAYFMAKNWDQIDPKESKAKYILGSIMGLSAMTFLFIATYQVTHPLLPYPASFDTQTLLLFTEIAAAISISYFILQAPTAVSYLSLFFIIPLGIVWGKDYPHFVYAPLLSLKFAVLCTAIASLFTAAAVNRHALLHSEASPAQRLILDILWMLTGIFVMLLIWNICHQLFPTDNIARGVALTIYVIAAEALIYAGNLKQLKSLRIGGFATILFVVFHLLTEEVWNMPIIVRTITFVVIGLLLIGTAFYDKKYKKLR